jgi:hypothetical protein
MPKNNCDVNTILTHTVQTNQAFQPKKGQPKQGRSLEENNPPTTTKIPLQLIFPPTPVAEMLHQQHLRYGCSADGTPVAEMLHPQTNSPTPNE